MYSLTSVVSPTDKMTETKLLILRSFFSALREERKKYLYKWHSSNEKKTHFCCFLYLIPHFCFNQQQQQRFWFQSDRIFDVR